jgi:hypothetical protein
MTRLTPQLPAPSSPANQRRANRHPEFATTELHQLPRFPVFLPKAFKTLLSHNNLTSSISRTSHTRSRPSIHHTHTFIMPRQRSSGRAGPARAPARPTAPAPAAPQQQRPAATMAAPPPQAHAPPAAASQGPGLFGQMASTAAYVPPLLSCSVHCSPELEANNPQAVSQ